MTQPAITPDGITYDYFMVAPYIEAESADPITKRCISVQNLYPNRALREMIEAHIQGFMEC